MRSREAVLHWGLLPCELHSLPKFHHPLFLAGSTHHFSARIEDGDNSMASSKKLNGHDEPGEESNEVCFLPLTQAPILLTSLQKAVIISSTTTPAPFTDNMTLEAVRTKVLSTTELLEAIIVCLPAQKNLRHTACEQEVPRRHRLYSHPAETVSSNLRSEGGMDIH